HRRYTGQIRCGHAGNFRQWRGRKRRFYFQCRKIEKPFFCAFTVVSFVFLLFVIQKKEHPFLNTLVGYTKIFLRLIRQLSSFMLRHLKSSSFKPLFIFMSVTLKGISTDEDTV